MYKCKDCGHVFEDYTTETLSEYSNGQCYQEVIAGCPECHSENFDEATQCGFCGRYCLPDEIDSLMCDECFAEIEMRFDNCYVISQDDEIEKATITINPLLASIFTESQIEEILLKTAREAADYSRINCSAFIERDKRSFEKVAIKLSEDLL